MKKAIGTILTAVLLCALSAAADVYQQGKILSWDKGTYPDKKNVKSWIVYQLQGDTTTYSIARKKENKPRLQAGELVQYKVKGNKVTVVEANGKKEDYEMVGQSAAPRP